MAAAFFSSSVGDEGSRTYFCLLMSGNVQEGPLSEVRQVFPEYQQKCLDIAGFLLLGQPGRIA
jgi:hypothetical protein